jgi:hypothetical protein
VTPGKTEMDELTWCVRDRTMIHRSLPDAASKAEPLHFSGGN